MNLLHRFPSSGVSTGVLDNAPPEYVYFDNTFVVERKSDSNLDSEKAENDISFTSCSAYGTDSNLQVEKDENEISFTSCSAYGVHKLPATVGDTNYEVIN